MAGRLRSSGHELEKIVAIVLLVAGALALIYGGFSYTKDTTALKLGPIELSVKENTRVNIPLWRSIAAIAAGGVLLIAARKRS